MAGRAITLSSSFVLISEEDATECRQRFALGGVKACEAFLSAKAEEPLPFNIGIVGNSGAGKSSFINAICGLTGNEDTAAKVGVTETTSTPWGYNHPENRLLKFWDVPWVEAENFHRDAYLCQIGLTKFDFFILVAGDRFTAIEKWFADAIAAKEKSFFYIRTKVHEAVQQDEHAHPKTHNRPGILEAIRTDVKTNLGVLCEEDGVFLIDNHHRLLFDFDRLKSRIEELLSEKEVFLVHSVATLSTGLENHHQRQMHCLVWLCSILCTCIAVLPVPGLSFVLRHLARLMLHSYSYFHQLESDYESLRQVAKIIGCNVAHLFQKEKGAWTFFFSAERIEDLMQDNVVPPMSSFLPLFFSVPYLILCFMLAVLGVGLILFNCILFCSMLVLLCSFFFLFFQPSDLSYFSFWDLILINLHLLQTAVSLCFIYICNTEFINQVPVIYFICSLVLFFMFLYLGFWVSMILLYIQVVVFLICVSFSFIFRSSFSRTSKD